MKHITIAFITLTALVPLLASQAQATCAEYVRLMLHDPTEAESCAWVSPGSTFPSDTGVYVTLWSELCCWPMGPVDEPSPCDVSPLSSEVLTVSTAAGEPVEGSFEPAGYECSAQPVLRFSAELPPGDYTLRAEREQMNFAIGAPGTAVVPPIRPSLDPTTFTTETDPGGGGCVGCGGNSAATLIILLPVLRRRRHTFRLG